jgi:hypothetical protein
MSGYKSFAVWGAGAIGKPIVVELLKFKSSGAIEKVSVLTRPVCSNIDAQRPFQRSLCPMLQTSKDNETNKALAAQGATIIPFDIDAAGAADSLSGIEVIISALRFGREAEAKNVHLLKQHGVKLFVPSAWGDSADIAIRTQPESVWTPIINSCAEAEKINLPVATFSCGPWPEYHT